MAAIQDNYRLIRFGSDGNYNFTDFVDSFSWTSDLDTLGSQLSFAIAKVPNQPTINIANIISLVNNGVEVYRGVIADESGTWAKKSLVAYDFAWYLNKSSIPIQFKKLPASDAIKKLCSKAGVPIGKIGAMSTPITKIYRTETVADVIKDIINQHEKATGVKMRMEMILGKLDVYKWGDIEIFPLFKPAPNLSPFSITDAYGRDWEIKRTAADLVNRVVAIKDGAFTTVGDSASIAAFGLLQEVIEVEKGQNARMQAQNTLAEKNVIPEELTLPLLGDDSMIAGRILKLPDAISGRWLIKAAAHTVAANIHKCDVTLKRLGA